MMQMPMMMYDRYTDVYKSINKVRESLGLDPVKIKDDNMRGDQTDYENSFLSRNPQMMGGPNPDNSVRNALYQDLVNLKNHLAQCDYAAEFAEGTTLEQRTLEAIAFREGAIEETEEG
jgi:hypothetical protein